MGVLPIVFDSLVMIMRVVAKGTAQKFPNSHVPLFLSYSMTAGALTLLVRVTLACESEAGRSSRGILHLQCGRSIGFFFALLTAHEQRNLPSS